jgi:hypothetical protein
LCAPDCPPIIQRMATPIRLLLEIEPVEDSLLGRVSTSEGDSREFAGWLGLLNTLEALIAERHPQVDQPQHGV